MLNPELQEIFKGNSRDRFVEVIEFYHKDTNTRYFFAKYLQDINIILEDGTTQLCKPANFQIGLPTYQESGNLDISIGFSSVGFSALQEIENILKNYKTKIIVKYRLYLENSYSVPAMTSPFKFSIKGMNIDKRTISFTGSLLLSIQKKVPARKFTIEDFRGLKYKK